MVQFSLDLLPHSLRITTYAYQGLKRYVLPDQRFGLVSLLLARIVWVVFEITALQRRPVDAVQLSEISEIFGHARVGMLVCEHERNTLCRQMMEGRHEDHDFIIWNPLHTSIARLYTEY